MNKAQCIRSNISVKIYQNIVPIEYPEPFVYIKETQL